MAWALLASIPRPFPRGAAPLPAGLLLLNPPLPAPLSRPPNGFLDGPKLLPSELIPSLEKALLPDGPKLLPSDEP